MALNLTTIDYDQPIENLIAGLNATGHITHRAFKKLGCTFHHNGGILTPAQVLAVWRYRAASAQFDSGPIGQLAQYANMFEYAWATGNTRGNQISVSIEMANSTLAPTWEVAEVTWQSAARLAGFLYATPFLIGTRPVPGQNIWTHHDWLPTACFGPFMDKIRGRLDEAVVDYYNAFKGGRTPVAPTPPKKPAPVTAPPPKPTPAPAKPAPATWVAGPKVGKALQDHFRSPGRHDGHFDTQDNRRRVNYPADHWTCIRWVPPAQARPSIGVVAIQKGVGATADGILGPATAAGLQRWAGLKGADVDSILGNVSVAAIARKLGVA